MSRLNQQKNFYTKTTIFAENGVFVGWFQKKCLMEWGQEDFLLVDILG